MGGNDANDEDVSLDDGVRVFFMGKEWTTRDAAKMVKTREAIEGFILDVLYFNGFS